MAPVGTNGAGTPIYPVDQVRPGSIVYFGVDDDMTMLVVANYLVKYMRPDCDVVDRQCRVLVYYGCFCEPGNHEYGRLMTCSHGLKETIAVVMMS
jgi:hypothetical protein